MAAYSTSARLQRLAPPPDWLRPQVLTPPPLQFNVHIFTPRPPRRFPNTKSRRGFKPSVSTRPGVSDPPPHPEHPPLPPFTSSETPLLCMVVPHNIRLHSRFAAKCEFYPLVTTSFTLSLAHILLSSANAMSAVGRGRDTWGGVLLPHGIEGKEKKRKGKNGNVLLGLRDKPVFFLLM